MKRALEVAGLLALAAVAWLCCESALTVRYARDRSVYTFDQVNKVLRESSQTLDELRKASTTWNEASKTQVRQVSSAMSNVGAAAAQFTTSFAVLEKSASSVFSATQTAIEQQNATGLLNQARLGADLDSLQSAVKTLDRLTADADAQISSPDIKTSLENFSLSSKQMADGMTNLAGVTKDAKDAADYELAQLRKPASVWLGVLKFVLSYGSDARVLFTGGVK